MNRSAWRTFLEAYSEELLACERAGGRVSTEATVAGWMGYDGATAEQLVELEARPRVGLPPPYRGFLAASNGWRHPGPSVYYLWPAERVVWFAEQDGDWIDAYTRPYAGLPPLTDEEYFVHGEGQSSADIRTAYLRTALQISEEGDSAAYLLNPQVVTPTGDWEAWFFANWLPRATRYMSFGEMMRDERDNLLKLRSGA